MKHTYQITKVLERYHIKEVLQEVELSEKEFGLLLARFDDELLQIEPLESVLFEKLQELI